MSLDIRSIESQSGTWTAEETRTVAEICMTNLSDSDFVNMIADYVFGDEALVDELITRLDGDENA